MATGPLLRVLAHAGIEVIATHVFDDRHTLHFVDAPQHAYDAWRREFLARHAGPAVRLDLRHGGTWDAIESSAQDAGADLVVLAWAQHFSPGRAVVVSEALANPAIPVLLLPTGGGSEPEAQRA